NRLNRSYYDTQALQPNYMLQEILKGLNKSIPELLIEWQQGSSSPLKASLGELKKDFGLVKLKDNQDLINLLREIFSWISQNYQGEAKLEEIEYAALSQMLRGLDPHSTLFTPEAFKEFKTQTQGEFGGIGIVIGMKDDELTVISPLAGTPASNAGLRAKDKIVQINEESTINMDLSEAVDRLRGKVGTQVTLTLERKGAPTPITVTLTRDIIKIESVQSSLFKDPKGDLGIIHVKSFGEDTVAEVSKQLRNLREDPNFKGLILDLRNNPGGLLDQAIDMSDLFLKAGRIVLTVGAQDEILKTNQAGAGEEAEDLPLIVLINEGSASASEIVAGALKKNNRAMILGRTSFGKGSVQSIYPLDDDSALKITIAQYLTADRASIQGVGIVPDIKLVPQVLDEEETDLIEDKNFGEKDLDKHLTSGHTLEEKPKFRLSYFHKISKEEEEEKNYSQEIQVDKDEELQIAAEVLLNTLESKDRLTSLKKVEGTLKKIKESESKKLAQALAKKGLDWSLQESPPGGEIKVQVQVEVLNSSKVDTLDAGKEQEIQLSIKNSGSVPLQRLIGYTESDYYLLNNKEFLFGRL
ncbi:MAG: PDZ domain-containing protein, partial [Deltaproteobacteria bacterium]|nr:PDZ domain-containing protein [Deltaproteobacteria bacterium]